MLFLRWSLKQKGVAHESVGLTFCPFFYKPFVAMFICGGVRRYTWSPSIVGEFAVADNGTLGFWENLPYSIWKVKGALP